MAKNSKDDPERETEMMTTRSTLFTALVTLVIGVASGVATYFAMLSEMHTDPFWKFSPFLIGAFVASILFLLVERMSYTNKK